MAQRTVRGAVTTEDTKESILKDTTDMLQAIIDKNNICIDTIVSIIFTATKDITAVYPAAAARQLDITDASLLCMQEMYVEGSLKKCIRCLVTVDTEKPQSDMIHIYMKDAVNLRPDLAE